MYQVVLNQIGRHLDQTRYRSTRVMRLHTPSDDFQSWVPRQRGGRTEDDERCVYAMQPLRQNISNATIFLMFAPLRHVFEETGPEIRPRGCVISSPYYGGP